MLGLKMGSAMVGSQAIILSCGAAVGMPRVLPSMACKSCWSWTGPSPPSPVRGWAAFPVGPVEDFTAGGDLRLLALGPALPARQQAGELGKLLDGHRPILAGALLALDSRLVRSAGLST